MIYSKTFKAIFALVLVAFITICAIMFCMQISPAVGNDIPLADSEPAKTALPDNLKAAAADSYLTGREALTAPLHTDVAAVALSENTSTFSDPESYPLYDFNGNLTAYCVLYDDGYSIINSTTETVYETALSKNPYFGVNADKYIYISPLNYAYQSGGNYYFVGNNDVVLDEQAVAYLQSKWGTLVARDLATIAEDENTQVKSVALADPDMSRIHLLYSDTAHIIHASYFFLIAGSGSYGLLDDGDWTFPNNNGTSCAYVAMTMLLQYYERTGLHDMIPSSFDNYLPASSVSTSKTQAIHNTLWNMGGGSFAMTDKIVSVFNDYFEKYGYGAKASYNALYSGMKGSIDNHRPAIGEIGYYKGFLWNSTDGSFTTKYISNHQVVVFAYTTKSSGILQNFVCHTGWGGYDPLVINKAAFFANTEVTVPGV